MQDKAKILLMAAVCVLAVALVVMVCRDSEPAPTAPLVLHDTIYRTDTVIEHHTTTRYLTRHDTCIIVHRDTLRDTLHIEIPIAHRQYTDTLIRTDTAQIAVDIRYSGYRARLDSVGISYTLRPIAQMQTKRSGWGQFVGIGVGVQYGLGVNPYNMQAAFQPSIGIGVVYGFGYHW